MVSAIYKPSTQAEEYAEWATNPYIGCGHGCRYCYVPNTMRISRSDFDAGARLREGYLEALREDARKLRKRGLFPQVMLSFSTDPYHPGDNAATRCVLEILAEFGHSFCTLTKGGERSLRDIDLFRPTHDSYAVTLTSLDEGLWRKWEPNSAPPRERIEILKEFSGRNIFTWVSLEPAFDAESTMEIIDATHAFVDLYKVGRANNLGKITRDTDWKTYTEQVTGLLQKLEAAHYVKKDLQGFIPEGYPNDMRVRQTKMVELWSRQPILL